MTMVGLDHFADDDSDDENSTDTDSDDENSTDTDSDDENSTDTDSDDENSTDTDSDDENSTDTDSDSDTSRETRVGHCKHDDTDTYVGRGTDNACLNDVSIGQRGWLGNPYPVDRFTREEAVSKFRDEFESELEKNDKFRDAVASLHGETLGCWCQRVDETSPQCHGEVIAEWADRLAGDSVDENSVDIGDDSDERPPVTSPQDFAMGLAARNNEAFERGVDFCSDPERLRAAVQYEAETRARQERVATINQRLAVLRQINNE